MQPIYISQASIIAPQHVYNEQLLLQPPVKDIDRKFSCIEPDYTALIPAMQLRRMSRLLKMGIYTGMSCLQKGGVQKPDGIITGTGKGSMTDTELFVKELNYYKEEALNPTPFIRSTYNAVNGAIALQTQATGYNQTFVHRGSSLELALYDAQLKLHLANKTQQYLVGCFDEMTDEYFHIKNKIGYWKQNRDNSIPLHRQCDTPGSIAGEGASFFLLSNRQESSSSLAINHVHTFYRPLVQELPGIIDERLQQLNIGKEDITMLVLGMNGDQGDQPYYDEVIKHIGEAKPALIFKDLCGEYETASGFGLWLTLQTASGKDLPEHIWINKCSNPRKGTILFYNHYRGINHNLMLLT